MSEQGTLFIIIDAIKQEIRPERHPDLKAAERSAGLSGVDHGVLMRGVGYVVYEYGFFDPVDRQRFWRFGNRLVAGNAVLYGFNETGETADIELDELRRSILIGFFRDAAEVERAIKAGIVARPQHTRNGVVTWQWPQPKPEYMKR